MGWFTALVLYLLIWWTLLFAILPFGTRPVEAPDPATGWRGVPQRPLMLRKIIATTLISAVIWAGLYIIISHEHWLSFRSGWLALPDQ